MNLNAEKPIGYFIAIPQMLIVQDNKVHLYNLSSHKNPLNLL